MDEPRLLRLPGEIRNQIYDYVSGSIGKVMVRDGCTVNPEVTRVCRQLRQEYLPIFRKDIVPNRNIETRVTDMQCDLLLFWLELHRSSRKRARRLMLTVELEAPSYNMARVEVGSHMLHTDKARQQVKFERQLLNSTSWFKHLKLVSRGNVDDRVREYVLIYGQPFVIEYEVLVKWRGHRHDQLCGHCGQRHVISNARGDHCLQLEYLLFRSGIDTALTLPFRAGIVKSHNSATEKEERVLLIKLAYELPLKQRQLADEHARFVKERAKLRLGELPGQKRAGGEVYRQPKRQKALGNGRHSDPYYDVHGSENDLGNVLRKMADLDLVIEGKYGD